MNNASRNAHTLAGHSWKPWRGPFQRWPLLSDFSLAAASFVITLFMWTHESGAGELRMATIVDVAALTCAFVGNFALLWRRSHPVSVHIVVLAGSLLVLLLGVPDGIFALTFSLYSLGRYAENDKASLLGMLAALAYIVIDLFALGTPGLDSVIAAGLVALLWYVGRRLRFRGEYMRLLEERAEHLDRERHIEAERAVAEERTRIARELHDVVAHQVSLMTVQAGAANTVAARDPKAAAEAMSAVEKAGRQALSEMRHLLSVLRPNNPVDELGPQPGIVDLARLAREVSDAGPDVHLEVNGNTSGLPARVDLAVYRIIQEALTNVLKHAGTGVHVDVDVEVGDTGIEIRVEDNGDGSNETFGKGHGIAGMRERAELLGGSLTAGRTPAGGFQVAASLPLGDPAQ